jgi:hypothetical protein
MSWGSFLAGLIVLALAQPVLSGASQHAGTLADLAKIPGVFVSRFMDPTVPAFSSPAPTVPASSGSSGGGAGTGGSNGTGSAGPSGSGSAPSQTPSSSTPGQEAS